MQVSTSYDELLHAFKAALRHALLTGRLSPICADFDVALIFAIGDVARAVRDGSRTNDLVREACRVFGQYAVHHDSGEGWPRQAVRARAADEARRSASTPHGAYGGLSG